MLRTIYVTAPDGSRLTRQTHRVYSHAILVHQKDGTYSAHSWCGRPELANAKHAALVKVYPDSKFIMSPVLGEV